MSTSIASTNINMLAKTQNKTHFAEVGQYVTDFDSNGKLDQLSKVVIILYRQSK